MSRITRGEFIKTAAGGTAGLAFLGAAGVAGSTYPTYLPSGGSRMNVVVVSLGSLRRDHVGVYGNDWIKTPNLDALANDSMRFTRPYPESLPGINARRTLYTGLRTWPFRDWASEYMSGFPAGWQWIPESQTSLTSALTGIGYNTALITDGYHQFEPSMNFQRGFSVFDFIRGQGGDHYRSVVPVSDERLASYTVPGNDEAAREKARQYLANTAGRNGEEDYFAPQVFQNSMRTLEAASRMESPFFLFADCAEPAEPWDPPEPYASMYGEPIGGYEPTIPNDGESGYLEEAELRRMRELYAGSATMTDKWFGDFMDKMQELDLFSSTLLIVFSDHGVALGEHGYTGKVPEAIWPELTSGVLYVRHPEGKGAGQTSDYRASLHDIAPTILAVSGTEQPTEGQDLGAILDGRQPEQRQHLTLGYDNYSWTEDEDYALSVRNDGDQARLYDLREDPDMENDISGENRDVVRRMYEDYIIADAGGQQPPMY